MSCTGTRSMCPRVPAQIDTTCSCTGYGRNCGCLSSSTSREPRASARLDTSSRSEPKAANASSSRYADRSSRSVPDDRPHGLDLRGAADPGDRDTDVDRRPDALS